MKALVTAARGNMGREVIPALVAAGVTVRGFRATGGADREVEALGASEIAIGDLRDAAAVAAAIDGVDAVFHVCPGGLAYWEREIGFDLIDSARRLGVRRIVLSTLMHPILTGLLQHETKRDVEERLVESGLDWTILQPTDYLQTRFPPSAFRTGVLPVSYGMRTRQSGVDLADVAAVVAKVLVEGEDHVHARYELSGLPRDFDAQEMADTAAAVCGREIVLEEVSTREMMRLWEREPGPPIASPHGLEDPEGRAFARAVLEHITSWYGEHDYVGNPNVLTWLLGRPPTSLREYLERLYAESSEPDGYDPK